MDKHSNAIDDGSGDPRPRGIRLTAPSLAMRKTPRRSRGSHCGTVVAFAKPRAIAYEAKGEADVACMLLATPGLVDLREQIGPVHYVDADSNKRHTYFDFLATFVDGRRVAVAVKPSALAEKKGFEDTLRTIAEQMPRSLAHEVWLMSERNATPEKAANARYALSVRTDPATGDDDIVAVRAGTLEGAVAIRSLIEDWKLEVAGMRAVMRGIDRDLLVVVGPGRISPDSIVTRGPRAVVATGGKP